jgi:Dolichyl-phosphate-mannose-protein mannosyltransferase
MVIEFTTTRDISAKTTTSRFPALVCALLLPLCALAVWPVVEMGINDDWSYIKTVQLLAQTGHIVYNGWAAPILGWQLYIGALFVKLFGFSFTSVRASMLLIAMATAYLTQRTMVRAGIHNWNATLGTIVLTTSPLFLPLAFTFMTDVPGLFSITLCLYACLRALQADTDRAAFAWICFAAISNAIGGTARQIAWLGVLIMVPSALWLLRRRSHILVKGGLLYIASVAFIYASIHWFHQQPYSVPENLIRDRFTFSSITNLVDNLLRASLDTPLLMLPILLLFVPVFPWRNRRALVILAIGSAGCIFFALSQIHRHKFAYWLAPFLGNYVTIYGLVEDVSLHGPKPVVLSFGVRLFITLLLLASLLSFFAYLFTRFRRPSLSSNTPSQISWYQLGVLIVPFTTIYIGLLIPRAAINQLFDRYLLPLLMLSLLVILRYYQDQIRPLVPPATLVPIAIFAAFAIAGTHDSFALFRARLNVVDELRSAGVPPTAIDGGFEYNGWNQIEIARYINDPKIPVNPGDHFRPSFKDSFGVCPPLLFNNFSVVTPQYAMAFEPTSCLGRASFAPISFKTWLGPPSTTIYIVKVGQPLTR